MLRCLLATAWVALAAFICCSGVAAQEDAAEKPKLLPRKLAPGVLTTIPPEPKVAETFSGPRPIVELTTGGAPSWTPQVIPDSDTLLARAKLAVLRRRHIPPQAGEPQPPGNIWHLEFSFKPLRMMRVNVPRLNASGEAVLEQKLVWYLVYRIRNLGGHMNPEPVTDGLDREVYPEEPERISHPVTFSPSFVLETGPSEPEKKQYLDVLIPSATRLIQNREDPAIKLYNSVEIMNQRIPVSLPGEENAVWGVATWMDIDPKIDYLSIYVQGLTNAYKFDDPSEPVSVSEPGKGRTFQRKLLRLNFWRPGDEYRQTEDEIRYGWPGDLAHEWVYR